MVLGGGFCLQARYPRIPQVVMGLNLVERRRRKACEHRCSASKMARKKASESLRAPLVLRVWVSGR